MLAMGINIGRQKFKFFQPILSLLFARVSIGNDIHGLDWTVT